MRYIVLCGVAVLISCCCLWAGKRLMRRGWEVTSFIVAMAAPFLILVWAATFQLWWPK